VEEPRERRIGGGGVLGIPSAVFTILIALSNPRTSVVFSVRDEVRERDASTFRSLRRASSSAVRRRSSSRA